MTTKDQEESPAQERPKDEVEEEDLEEVDMIEKWDSVVFAVRDTTKEAFSASPSPKETSVQEFQRYWRETFDKLAASVASDESIPQYLSEEPCRKFEIMLFTEPNTVCCPCSHAEVAPTILIENESGVTKEDLIRGFANYMYGDELPSVNFEEGEGWLTATLRKLPALVYKVSWMSSGRNDKGERIAFINMVDRIPNVFMYCCEPDEFEAKYLEHNKKK